MPGNARGKRLAAVRERTERAMWFRLGWREQVAACLLIRAALEEAGIDPARISCLGLGADGARMLAERGETPEREAADAAYAAEFLPDRDTMARRAAEREPRWSEGGTPFPWDSILDWLAWATVRGRMPADGENPSPLAGEAPDELLEEPSDDESKSWEDLVADADEFEEDLLRRSADLSPAGAPSPSFNCHSRASGNPGQPLGRSPLDPRFRGGDG